MRFIRLFDASCDDSCELYLNCGVFRIVNENGFRCTLDGMRHVFLAKDVDINFKCGHEDVACYRLAGANRKSLILIEAARRISMLESMAAMLVSRLFFDAESSLRLLILELMAVMLLLRSFFYFAKSFLSDENFSFSF